MFELILFFKSSETPKRKEEKKNCYIIIINEHHKAVKDLIDAKKTEITCINSAESDLLLAKNGESF